MLAAGLAGLEGLAFGSAGARGPARPGASEGLSPCPGDLAVAAPSASLSEASDSCGWAEREVGRASNLDAAESGARSPRSRRSPRASARLALVRAACSSPSKVSRGGSSGRGDEVDRPVPGGPPVTSKEQRLCSVSIAPRWTQGGGQALPRGGIRPRNASAAAQKAVTRPPGAVRPFRCAERAAVPAELSSGSGRPTAWKSAGVRAGQARAFPRESGREGILGRSFSPAGKRGGDRPSAGKGALSADSRTFVPDPLPTPAVKRSCDPSCS